MAFIRSKVVNGKKYFYIIWQDATKRHEISCKRQGAKNGEQRKALLKKFQEKEDAIRFQVEHQLYKVKAEEHKIADIADKYLSDMRKLQKLREQYKEQGISISHYQLIKNSTQRFLKYFDEQGIVFTSEINSNVMNEFRKSVELTGSHKIATKNNTLRYAKLFLNHFKFSDPPVFDNLELLCAVLKNFRENSILPFHFETDQLREIIVKAREFDEETCKITRKSKKQGKAFKDDMPAKNVPILPMILLVMLTGMRKSDALALKWSNVNLETGLIKYQAIKNRKICIVPLKGDPNGDISPEFIEILRKWRAERPKDIYVLPHPMSETPSELKHPIERFRKRLSETTAANFNWQNLRKNFESYAVSFGIPPAITAFWVGHSPAVAEKHYMSYAIGKLNAKNIVSAMSIAELLNLIL